MPRVDPPPDRPSTLPAMRARTKPAGQGRAGGLGALPGTFAAALRGARRGMRDAADGSEALAAAGGGSMSFPGASAPWHRSEGPVAGSARQPVALPQVPGASPLDRLLLGFGPDGAEARLRIGAGPLAGT